MAKSKGSTKQEDIIRSKPTSQRTTDDWLKLGWVPAKQVLSGLMVPKNATPEQVASTIRYHEKSQQRREFIDALNDGKDSFVKLCELIDLYEDNPYSPSIIGPVLNDLCDDADETLVRLAGLFDGDDYEGALASASTGLTRLREFYESSSKANISAHLQAACLSGFLETIKTGIARAALVAGYPHSGLRFFYVEEALKAFGLADAERLPAPPIYQALYQSHPEEAAHD
jgi:hypothetical protein